MSSTETGAVLAEFAQRQLRGAPQRPDNGDMHYWGVWHALEPIENYNLQNPRFMSEFGFQSFPEMRTILSFAQPRDLAIDSVR